MPTPVPLEPIWDVIPLPESDLSLLPINMRELQFRGSELWMLSYTDNLYMYDTASSELKMYELTEENLELYGYGRPLLIDSEGTIWAIAYYYVESSRDLLAPRTASLVRFDENLEAWLPVNDPDGWLKEDSYEVSQLVEDGQGNLWFIYGEALFRFEKATSKFHRVLDRTDGLEIYFFDLLVDELDGLWFRAHYTQEYIDKFEIQYPGDSHKIFRFDPRANQFQSYGYPFQANASIHIGYFFMDSYSRLWLNNSAWLQNWEQHSQHTWYAVVPTNLFITDYGGSFDYQYVRFRPLPRLETENRYLWFVSGAGVATLDLESGEWCLRSTSTSWAITKDAEENVWLYDNGQIYVYRNTP